MAISPISCQTGLPPLFDVGIARYFCTAKDTVDKRLVVNKSEARLVRRIFKRFCELSSTTQLADELNREGHRTKSWTTVKGKLYGGKPWNKAHVYRVLNNVKYVGLVEHKGKTYSGEHEAIVTKKLWDDVHRILAANHRARANRTRARTPALLKGLIKCTHCSGAMSPSFSSKNGKRYRYYTCLGASKNGYGTCPVRTVAAGEIENAVVGQLRAIFCTPELLSRTYREARSQESEEIERLRKEKAKLERTGDPEQRLEEIARDLHALEAHAVTERDVMDALEQLDPIWQELFPGEQARIVQLLVQRVDVHTDGLEVRLRADGLRSLVAELGIENGAHAG